MKIYGMKKMCVIKDYLRGSTNWLGFGGHLRIAPLCQLVLKWQNLNLINLNCHLNSLCLEANPLAFSASSAEKWRYLASCTQILVRDLKMRYHVQRWVLFLIIWFDLELAELHLLYKAVWSPLVGVTPSCSRSSYESYIWCKIPLFCLFHRWGNSDLKK